MFDNLSKLLYQPLVETDRHNPENLAELSKLINYSIPGDYVEFLRRYPDTGIFEIDGVVFIASSDRLPGNHDGRYAVDTLYAACSDKRYDLFSIRREDAGLDLIPNYCLRVGEDSFGNAFVLDLRADYFGQVYFWDHEHAPEASGLHLVAPSFTSFIDLLEVA